MPRSTSPMPWKILVEPIAVHAAPDGGSWSYTGVAAYDGIRRGTISHSYSVVEKPALPTISGGSDAPFNLVLGKDMAPTPPQAPGDRLLESSTRLRRPARQRRVDFLHEVLQREVRLDEVRRRAQRRRLLDVPILAEVRQHDDRDARRGGVLLERLQDVEPLELGHDDVEKHEIRTLRARDPQRLLAVDRREHLEPVLAQPRLGRPAQEAVVLREEDPSGSLSHAGRPARARPARPAPEATDWTSRSTRKPPEW